jgi:predicted phage terminase large subunit-like protein
MERGIYLPQADPMGRAQGEALWPEKYSRGSLARMAAVIGESEFSSQYQQMPRPAKGNLFEESDFEMVVSYPAGLRWFVYIDLALGETKKADWNAAVAAALDEKTGHLYYRDLLWVQDLTEFLAQLRTWMLRPEERGTTWGVESVAFSKLVWKDFMKDKHLATLAIVPVVPDGDKVSRARPIQTRGRQGLVRVRRADWWRRAWNEGFGVFPNGAHDDVVDAFSGCLQMIADEEGGSGKTETADAVAVDFGAMFGGEL